MATETLNVRTGWRTVRELPRAVVVLVVGNAVNRMGSYVQIFLMLYLTSIGIHPASAGIVLTGFGVGTVAGVLVGGVVVDRVGPKATIISSTCVSGLLVGSLALTHTYGVLLALATACGFVATLYRPAASWMLAELTPASRLVMTTATYRLGLNIGATLAPLIGVFLATRSYKLVFLTDAVTSIAFALLVATQLPSLRPARPESGKPGTYLDVVRDRRFSFFLGAQFLTSFAEVQYLAILPLEVKARGLPIAVYGTIVAINGALVILLELPLTPYVQRLPMRSAVSLGCTAIGVGLALCGLRVGVWILFLGALVWTMGEVVSAPSVSAYPALVGPRALRGRYIGAFSTSQTLGYALGPSAGAALFQYYGAGTWALCGALGLLAGAGMLASVLRPGAMAERVAASQA